jgi:hypothetical protein
MSQQGQGGGGWGQPPGNQGWGGAPPDGGQQQASGGYGPPPGGGYAPPGAPGGYGPPPGAPPGGGGYGQPPAQSPYGAPPGGGFGAPPGGGYGAPGGFGGGPGGPMASGVRALFAGDGGKLFVIYIVNYMLPLFAVIAVYMGLVLAGQGIAHATDTPALAIPFGLMGLLVYLGGLIGTIVVFSHKFNKFYYDSFKLDGEQAEYTGDLKGLAGAMAVNLGLCMVTFGIYAPWAIVAIRKYLYANISVGGRPGRLTFEGSPGELFGKFIVGILLTYCTLGIYSLWFAQDMFAFKWENTKIDGRPFGFRKDVGGFFGTYLVNVLLTYVTCGIYAPWMMCNLVKWESEHVS